MNNKLTNLLDEVLDCHLCEEHLALGPRPIIQVSSEARILIAGQAPGRKVHETGIPFNDPSGDRLRNWMGIEKSTFYDTEKIAILPMGFCYPGTGKSGDLPPRPECAEAWREKLLKCLPEVQLTLVIGRYAHQYHFKGKQSKTLSDTVKAWRDFLPQGLLPLPHPSPRNNNWLKKNKWFEKDILLILKDKVKKLIK